MKNEESKNLEYFYQRTEILIGEEGFKKLKNSNVCICGIGGVGSFVFEALVRTGIGRITVIDKDVVDVTNINRQIIALRSTVGVNKVEVALKRAKDINENIKIKGLAENISVKNVDGLITKDYDYVIDAIDDVEAKVAIIKCCEKMNIKIISSMGMANRLDPLAIRVIDISKTESCPLAKIIRKKLREERIDKLKVVCSKETPLKINSKTLGSISYVPSVAGLIIASEVIKDLLKKN